MSKDIRKVISGINSCARNCGCKNCPYCNGDLESKDCLEDLLLDVYEILSDIDRPRVLTYDEAKELKIGTDIWIEYKHKLMIISGTFKSFTQGAVYKWFNLYGVDFSIRAMEYGKAVRFWTGRPTGKQREEVGWNE